MTMQGIDISYCQAGLNLAGVPFDFAIFKATQGNYIVDETCDGFVQQAKALGKPWGVYHYVGGGGAVAEADFFVDNIQGYIGQGLLAIDWEGQNNEHFGDDEYLRQLVQRVIDRTGIKPLIYAPESGFPWDVASALGCGMWVAQYADNSQTGYQDAPWNEGSYACAIRQYSSHGRLSGWGGDLDLDKAYMDADAWAKFAAGSGDAKATEQTGWIKQDGRWWYRHADGSYTKDGWEQIDGKWYLFDADGWMLTGWQQVGGKWYYLTDSGAMATGWLQKDGKWYWLDPDSGAMHAADVQSIGGRWYAFGADGEMKYGVGSDSTGALEV